MADWSCSLSTMFNRHVWSSVISVVAHFTRWCRFVAQAHNCRLLSIPTRLCIVVLPTAKFAVFIESLNQVALCGRVLPSELWLRVVNLTPSMPWMVSISTSYIDSSCSKVCLSAVLIKSFNIIFWSSHILSQPTKSWRHESHVERAGAVKLMHCIIAVHCTIPYTSRLHHCISFTSQ
jgi:hypothetical protein